MCCANFLVCGVLCKFSRGVLCKFSGCVLCKFSRESVCLCCANFLAWRGVLCKFFGGLGKFSSVGFV